jgi:hypothetical protein
MPVVPFKTIAIFFSDQRTTQRKSLEIVTVDAPVMVPFPSIVIGMVMAPD